MSRSNESVFVVVQVHPHREWAPSYLSAYDATGNRSFRKKYSEAMRFTDLAAAERLASRIRRTWWNDAGWQIEARAVQP